jgi:hypothetical protein
MRALPGKEDVVMLVVVARQNQNLDRHVRVTKETRFLVALSNYCWPLTGRCGWACDHAE